MRHTRLLLPVLLALAVGACASQQPAYYVTDAATGQRVAAAPQNTQPAERGLFGSSAPQAGASYAYAAPQPQESPGRGLFNSDIFGSRSSAPVYAYQPQAPQTYSYQPTPRQAYAQQPATTRYRPPQPMQQAYAQPVYAPPTQPAGYYAERYRWY